MFVADLHNDVLQRAMIGEDISNLTNQGHSDFIRLNKSCINFEVFVVWQPPKLKNISPFKRANLMYDKIASIENKNKNLIKICNNLDEIKKARKNKDFIGVISIEGGEPIEDKIENLHHFINRGLFYFGFTWNNSLSWVSSNYDEKINKKNIKFLGINKFGVEVIKTCNENNVIIDVSHVGENSFWDIVKCVNKPIIASHSSVYNLCPHFRNLKDEQILAIKKLNGLVGLNPYPYFIDSSFENRIKKIQNTILNKFEKIYNLDQNQDSNWINMQHFLQKEYKKYAPTLDVFIDHIEYIIKLAGIDFVAIGSDYDGLDCLPKELNDCKDHIKIAEKLDERSYSTKDIEKIMGLNVLRVVELIKN